MTDRLTPRSVPVGTLRRALWGRLPLIGSLFAAFGLLALGISLQALQTEVTYSHKARQTTATIIDKPVDSASSETAKSTRYLVRYRFTAADGRTIYGSRELPFDRWNTLHASDVLPIRYLADRPYESRIGSSSDMGQVLGWGSVGLVQCGLGFSMLYFPLRRAARVERLLRDGVATQGTVEDVAYSGWRVNGSLMYRVRYSYRGFDGRDYAGRSNLLPKEKAHAWKKGEAGPVRYDAADPGRSIWVAWP